MTTWFLRHPQTEVVWVVTHEDTARRCLAEGYARVPDPNPEPEPVVTAPLPPSDPTPDPTLPLAAVTSPKRRGRPARP